MMKDNDNNSGIVQQQLLDFYKSNEATICADDTPKVRALRNAALQRFQAHGFPTAKMESWRSSKIIHALHGTFQMPSLDEKHSETRPFSCELCDIDTEIIMLVNGVFSGESSLKEYENGMVIGSTRAAMKARPDLFDRYFGDNTTSETNVFYDVNTALWHDGYFVYVPKNVTAERPIQVIKLIDNELNPFVQTRNLIILEENANLQLIDCDDSFNQQSSLINAFTEIVIGDNASLDKYKLQNINDNTILLNSNSIKQLGNSRFRSNTISFNGGMIRNNIHVALDAEGAEAQVYGLYLMDKHQHIDNYLKVDHKVPNCTSFDKFKGILDDEASAVFNGHVHVAPGAQKTNAQQNNSNILLTSKAKIDAKPFLEIYADDVKCAHGTSTGQLDQEAMFYMQQRGISKANARMLLMYAFAAEISNHIGIPAMQERIDDMIKRRLRGELSSCDNCVLRCSHPKEYQFEIDESKL